MSVLSRVLNRAILARLFAMVALFAGGLPSVRAQPIEVVFLDTCDLRIQLRVQGARPVAPGCPDRERVAWWLQIDVADRRILRYEREYIEDVTLKGLEDFVQKCPIVRRPDDPQIAAYTKGELTHEGFLDYERRQIRVLSEISEQRRAIVRSVNPNGLRSDKLNAVNCTKRRPARN